MEYKEIDLESWGRKEYFEHYTSAVPCTYSMTVKLDITGLRKGGARLYPAMLYLLSKTATEFEQFRTALRRDGKLVVYQTLHPSYTIFHKETETFSCIWTEYSEDYGEFLQRYNEDMEQYGKAEGFIPKPGMPENSFNISMIPWAGFESFQLNMPDYKYFLPIFTMGRYREENGRCFMPLAVQVHHAVCDGYHLSCFLGALQEKLEAWPKHEGRGKLC